MIMLDSKMKKRLLFLLAALCCALPAAAQDWIVRHDSARIEARVTEVSPAEVRYKRFSNPDGPTYVLPRGDIAAIRYANGEVEVFETPARVQTPAPASAASPEVAPRQYAVGDYYERGEVRGIVFQIEDDGWHGTILSLDEVSLPWCAFAKADAVVTGAGDLKDGRANMETLARYIADRGLSWDDFPAFRWCRERGEGWYLPAIDEMLVVGHVYNGGSRARYDRKARNRFNDTLRTHGGKRMDRMVYYFTSTEQDARHAYITHMDMEPPYSLEIPKNNKFLVRAVRRF